MGFSGISTHVKSWLTVFILAFCCSFLLRNDRHQQQHSLLETFAEADLMEAEREAVSGRFDHLPLLDNSEDSAAEHVAKRASDDHWTHESHTEYDADHDRSEVDGVGRDAANLGWRYRRDYRDRVLDNHEGVGGVPRPLPADSAAGYSVDESSPFRLATQEELVHLHKRRFDANSSWQLPHVSEDDFFQFNIQFQPKPLRPRSNHTLKRHVAYDIKSLRLKLIRILLSDVAVPGHLSGGNRCAGCGGGALQRMPIGGNTPLTIWRNTQCSVTPDDQCNIQARGATAAYPSQTSRVTSFTEFVGTSGPTLNSPTFVQTKPGSNTAYQYVIIEWCHDAGTPSVTNVQYQPDVPSPPTISFSVPECVSHSLSLGSNAITKNTQFIVEYETQERVIPNPDGRGSSCSASAQLGNLCQLCNPTYCLNFPLFEPKRYATNNLRIYGRAFNQLNSGGTRGNLPGIKVELWEQFNGNANDLHHKQTVTADGAGNYAFNHYESSYTGINRNTANVVLEPTAYVYLKGPPTQYTVVFRAAEISGRNYQPVPGGGGTVWNTYMTSDVNGDGQLQNRQTSQGAADLGFVDRLYVQGRVFLDVAPVGSETGADPGLANIVIRLVRAGTTLATIVTDSSGSWAVDSLNDAILGGQPYELRISRTQSNVVRSGNQRGALTSSIALVVNGNDWVRSFTTNYYASTQQINVGLREFDCSSVGDCNNAVPGRGGTCVADGVCSCLSNWEPPRCDSHCSNFVQDPGETDVDCGGTACARCAPRQNCLVNSDCNAANPCSTCVTALAGDGHGATCYTGSRCSTCDDFYQNQGETAVDAAGPCDRAEDGLTCVVNTDCKSGVCDSVNYNPAICVSCVDGLRNADETDVDCGGSCDRCLEGQQCLVPQDCQSPSTCDIAPPAGTGSFICASCTDGIQNQAETDVDCGGPCGPCPDGDGCLVADDCVSRVCTPGAFTCAVPTCADNVLNQNEADVDCGGPCPGCLAGQPCRNSTDCATTSCDALTQVCASCSDNILNQGEGAVDCGGDFCDRCPTGSPCLQHTDCRGSNCTANYCIPTCTDGVKNNGEDLLGPGDCGGPNCLPCLYDCSAVNACSGQGFCEAPNFCRCNQGYVYDPVQGCALPPPATAAPTPQPTPMPPTSAAMGGFNSTGNVTCDPRNAPGYNDGGGGMMMVMGLNVSMSASVMPSIDSSSGASSSSSFGSVGSTAASAAASSSVSSTDPSSSAVSSVSSNSVSISSSVSSGSSVSLSQSNSSPPQSSNASSSVSSSASVEASSSATVPVSDSSNNNDDNNNNNNDMGILFDENGCPIGNFTDSEVRDQECLRQATDGDCIEPSCRDVSPEDADFCNCLIPFAECILDQEGCTRVPPLLPQLCGSSCDPSLCEQLPSEVIEGDPEPPGEGDIELWLVILVAVLGAVCCFGLIVGLLLVRRRKKQQRAAAEAARETEMSDKKKTIKAGSKHNKEYAALGSMDPAAIYAEGSQEYHAMTMMSQYEVADVDLPPHPVEIDLDDIKVGKELGRGAFGVVFRGEWRNLPVAVKKLHGTNLDPKELDAFLKEADIMKSLPPHPNVIRLYGMSSDKEKGLAMITEFARGGSLDNYLRDHKVSVRQKIAMMVDICKGVVHLHEHNIIHRDLGVRNLLRNHLGLIKVADFGLSRSTVDDGAQTKTTTGPLRWMAPESLTDRQYSEATDAWTMGIVWWEIIMDAAMPYGKDKGAAQVALGVCQEGLRLDRPPNTTDQLWSMMQSCWSVKPKSRPDAKKQLATLKKIQKGAGVEAYYKLPDLATLSAAAAAGSTTSMSSSSMVAQGTGTLGPGSFSTLSTQQLQRPDMAGSTLPGLDGLGLPGQTTQSTMNARSSGVYDNNSMSHYQSAPSTGFGTMTAALGTGTASLAFSGLSPSTAGASTMVLGAGAGTSAEPADPATIAAIQSAPVFRQWDRKTAEGALQGKSDGTGIVRPSSKAGQFAVSYLKDGGSAVHTPVAVNGTEISMVNTDGQRQVFASIADVLMHLGVIPLS